MKTQIRDVNSQFHCTNLKIKDLSLDEMGPGIRLKRQREIGKTLKRHQTGAEPLARNKA
jgi:hypothetical protein